MPDPTPLDTLLDQCERIAQVHEHLRMDNPGDEMVRMDVVATARTALAQCHEIAARTRVAPDRAAALRDVETLLRRVRHVHTKLVEPEYDMTDDDEVIRPRTAPELAALIVDRVFGAEQDGEKQ